MHSKESAEDFTHGARIVVIRKHISHVASPGSQSRKPCLSSRRRLTQTPKQYSNAIRRRFSVSIVVSVFRLELGPRSCLGIRLFVESWDITRFLPIQRVIGYDSCPPRVVNTSFHIPVVSSRYSFLTLRFLRDFRLIRKLARLYETDE